MPFVDPLGTSSVVYDAVAKAPTANPPRAHQVTREAWLPIFQHFADKTPPDFAKLCELFPAEAGPRFRSISLPNLTGYALRLSLIHI